MKLKKIIGPIIVLLCIGVIAFVFFYVKPFSKDKGGMGGFGGFGGFGPGGQRENVVSVRTRIAEISTLHDYVNTNGEIEPQSSVDVYPDIGGKIVKVSVVLGSKVYRGQVIALIDPSVPGEYYANSPVTAPISGTITSSPLKVGMKISAGTAIAKIGDVANLQVSANGPERYVYALKTGLKADIELESYPGEKFSATVTKVSPLVDSVSRTKEVILNLDEKDDRVQAGMFAKVHLWTVDYEGAITLPTNSVIEVNDEKYVYAVKDDGTVERRYVTVGATVDDECQILEGISEGEKIVVEGMRVLSNGAKIRDIGEAKKEAPAENPTPVENQAGEGEGGNS
ncbi:MAG: efflux RND transporter periplasmic adaptor subunit [Treponema sp.]|nr:efflux RND transporter periplasmic adaptor subunit [Treponema sp.]